MQYLKAYDLMDVTDSGITICSKDVHLEKASAPIDVTDSGITICPKDVQL